MTGNPENKLEFFNYFILMLLGVVFFTAFSSCKKFLEVTPPHSQIPIATVFADDAMADGALAGIYLEMYSIGGFASGNNQSLTSLTGLMADELHNNPQTDPAIVEFEQNNLRAENIYIDNLWTSLYKSIYQINIVLESLEYSKGITSQKNNQFKGEALFLRAFCHFYLLNLFGDIPIVKTTNFQENSKVIRHSQVQVYKQVESDLLIAENLLQASYPGYSRVRPNKWAACALMSRVYLYQKNWVKAEEYASKVINQSTLYTLPVDLNNVFLGSSTEAIWQLKPSDFASFTNEGGLYSPANVQNNNSLANLLLHSFNNNDARKLNWITDRGTLYVPNKYKLFAESGQPSTEYSMVLRLAEQLLIRAEAKAQLNNIWGSNSALSDINTVRQRAGLQDTTAVNLNQLMGILERERRLEFFTEWGHRWFDLKRWNRSTEVLSPLKAIWIPADTVLPIPQNELNKNPFLKPQNSSY